MIYAAKSPNIWVPTNTQIIGFRLTFVSLSNETYVDKIQKGSKNLNWSKITFYVLLLFGVSPE